MIYVTIPNVIPNTIVCKILYFLNFIIINVLLNGFNFIIINVLLNGFNFIIIIINLFQDVNELLNLDHLIFILYCFNY
jgi:hypothetical protein